MFFLFYSLSFYLFLFKASWGGVRGWCGWSKTCLRAQKEVVFGVGSVAVVKNVGLYELRCWRARWWDFKGIYKKGARLWFCVLWACSERVNWPAGVLTLAFAGCWPGIPVVIDKNRDLLWVIERCNNFFRARRTRISLLWGVSRVFAGIGQPRLFCLLALVRSGVGSYLLFSAKDRPPGN